MRCCITDSQFVKQVQVHMSFPSRMQLCAAVLTDDVSCREIGGPLASLEAFGGVAGKALVAADLVQVKLQLPVKIHSVASKRAWAQQKC